MVNLPISTFVSPSWGDRERNHQLQDRILGVVVDLVKVPKEYETAIEVAIGGGIQNIVVE